LDESSFQSIIQTKQNKTKQNKTHMTVSFSSSKWLVHTYRRKKNKTKHVHFLPLRKHTFKIESIEEINRTSFRTVMRKNYASVYRPKNSRWYTATLSIGTKMIHSTTTKKQTINIQWPKTIKEFQRKRLKAKEKNYNINKVLFNKGLEDITLLTTTEQSNFLVIDGNHRSSRTFLNKSGKPSGQIKVPKDKSEVKVFVGIVDQSVFDTWSKWKDENLGQASISNY
jgi:hypothetical protein